MDGERISVDGRTEHSTRSLLAEHVHYAVSFQQSCRRIHTAES